MEQLIRHRWHKVSKKSAEKSYFAVRCHRQHRRFSAQQKAFMTAAITRSELFELVWSEPRTTLAKRFKLSDVAIGKHCRKANIPMPPPGYWARKLAGKTSTRPPLPLRLPGQRDQVFPGEEDRYGYFNRTEDLEEILLPPVFPESAQLLVADAANRIGNIRACRDLSNPHPGLKRVLADESRRREAWAAQKYADYYKPYFDAPNLQRQLRLINSILWGFDRIDCKGEAYITEEWVQGTGHLHLLHCRICIGTTTVGFELLEPTTPKSLNKAPPSGTTTLRIAAHPSGQSDWSDRADCKIEKQLTSIGVAMLELAENRLRNCATQAYERRLQRRQELLDAIARKMADDERKRLEAIAKHHQANRDNLRKMAREHQSAREVRNFVDAVREHPTCTGANLSAFSEWERKVLKFADSMDPLSQPITDIFNSFAEPPEAVWENGSILQ